MATIGIVDISIRALTEKASASLKTFQKGLSGLETGLGKLVSGANLFKAAIVGAVAGGTTMFVRGALDAIDETNDMANRLGTTTENLTSLRYAAKLTGTEMEDLDNSLKKMNQNLGDAAMGSGAAAPTLKKLGLNARELIDMDPADAFKKISGALVSIQNPALQASAAVDIFGKGGQALLTTLKAGPDQLNKLTAEAVKMGAAFSSLSANEVAAANDALDRMDYVLGGLKNQIAINLAPFIESLANGFTALATSGVSMGERISGAFEMVFKAVGVVADVLHTVKLGFLAFQTAVTASISGWVKAFDLLGRGFIYVANLMLPFKTEFTNVLTVMGEDLDRLVNDQWANFRTELAKEPPKAGVVNFFKDIKNNAAAAAQATVDKMKPVRDLAAGLEAPIKHAGAFELGSKEAQSAIVAHQTRAETNDPAKESLKVERAQLALQSKSVEALQKIASLLAPGPGTEDIGVVLRGAHS